MSIVDLDSLSPNELIAQYVVECRGKGHFLPYEDHEVIEQWLRYAKDPEALLIILSENLPGYFRKFHRLPNPPPLKGIQRFITSKLKASGMLNR